MGVIGRADWEEKDRWWGEVYSVLKWMDKNRFDKIDGLDI